MENLNITKYSKMELPPPRTNVQIKLELNKEQSELFWSCIERFNGVLSTVELFGYACSDIDRYVEIDNFREFFQHMERSINFVSSGLYETIYDLLDLIDY